MNFLALVAHHLSLSSVSPRLQRLVYRVRSADGAWSSERLAIESFVALAFAVPASKGEQLLSIVYRDAGITASYAHGTPQNLALETVSYSASDVALALQPVQAVHLTSLEFTSSDSYFVTYRTNRVVSPDGVDQNCDGVDGVDHDRDDEASLHSGGSDCDDYLANVTGLAGSSGAVGCQLAAP
jgi:hypothetical protein